jgi:hypothetical protein
LQSGELVSDPDIDWSFAVGQEIELQLVEPMGSRTADEANFSRFK